jgi:hypothetical protein
VKDNAKIRRDKHKLAKYPCTRFGRLPSAYAAFYVGPVCASNTPSHSAHSPSDF